MSTQRSARGQRALHESGRPARRQTEQANVETVMKSAARVFLINWPSFFDRSKNCMVQMKMDTAENFGELKTIFPGSDRPPSPDEALPILVREMATFRPEDFLVLAGDWDLVTWAAVLAARATKGHLNLLKWDNRGRRYQSVKLPGALWEDGSEPVNV